LGHRIAFATTNSIDRFRGTCLPFSRQTITASPYFHLRFAVARLIPISQQIAFHGLPFARSQTIRASFFPSYRSQSIASSASLIIRGDGSGRRIRGS
jgi:hypothetical protein